VYLGKWKSTNVAMKQIKLSDTSIEEFEREFAVLSKLRHPRKNTLVLCLFISMIDIVSFLKLHVDKDKNKYLVFEYIAKGSLLDVLHSKQGKLTTHQKLKMACDIAKVSS
jgi:serine/threonine protein kinase